MATERGRSSGQQSASPANITQNLKGLHYPANKQSILQQAKQNGAAQSVLDVINKMPSRDYVNMAEFMKEYGKEH
jgi:hypothetical protein